MSHYSKFHSLFSITEQPSTLQERWISHYVTNSKWQKNCFALPLKWDPAKLKLERPPRNIRWMTSKSLGLMLYLQNTTQNYYIPHNVTQEKAIDGSVLLCKLRACIDNRNGIMPSSVAWIIQLDSGYADCFLHGSTKIPLNTKTRSSPACSREKENGSTKIWLPTHMYQENRAIVFSKLP
jgi:hypothetical protein